MNETDNWRKKMSRKRKKRKWWFSKPRGNCPPSRKWLRYKQGRDLEALEEEIK